MPELRGELTEEMDDFVDEQVEQGFYPSRAELQRAAIRKLMKKENYSPYRYPNLENRKNLDDYPEESDGGEQEE